MSSFSAAIAHPAGASDAVPTGDTSATQPPCGQLLHSQLPVELSAEATPACDQFPCSHSSASDVLSFSSASPREASSLEADIAAGLQRDLSPEGKPGADVVISTEATSKAPGSDVINFNSAMAAPVGTCLMLVALPNFPCDQLHSS